MAHVSKDGSRWTNLSQAKAADRKFGAVPVPGRAQGDGKQPLPSSAFPKPEPARAATAKPVGDTQDTQSDDQLSQVVSEHGPAKHVTVSKVDGGKYHLSTGHDDGFKHESDHASAEDAFGAAGTLSGIEPGGSAPDDELPDLSRVM